MTGCSSGIGAAIATHVLAQNHRLIATARKPSTLSYLPDDNPNVLKLALDVTSTSSIDIALEATLKHFGRIDVLVNNAGYNAIGIAESLPLSTYRTAMETNFFGPMQLSLRAVGIMRDINPSFSSSGVQGGTIINVSSIRGRCALPAEAPYHASKFALEGFSEALSSELDPAWGIRVMILEPGGTKSDFLKQSSANAEGGEGSVGGKGVSGKYGAELSVRQMISALTDTKLREGLVEASTVAQCLFDVLMENEKLPMRLPTGSDAYGLIESREMAKMEELRGWKEVSCGVGDANIPA